MWEIPRALIAGALIGAVVFTIIKLSGTKYILISTDSPVLCNTIGHPGTFYEPARR